MDREFDFAKVKIAPEIERKRKSAQTHNDQGEEFFAKTWIWQWHVLRDKRAGGFGSSLCWRKRISITITKGPSKSLPR